VGGVVGGLMETAPEFIGPVSEKGKSCYRRASLMHHAQESVRNP
jgi:hypothetical protein